MRGRGPNDLDAFVTYVERYRVCIIICLCSMCTATFAVRFPLIAVERGCELT